MSEQPKNILFVCVGNSCRSQMAEGFARRYGEGVVNVYSAGLSPAGVVSDGAKTVMAEKGIDISSQRSKALDEINLPDMDAVITLGCCTANSFCPVTFQGEKIDWDIEDPFGQPLEVFRETRDKVEEKVRGLIEKIKQESTRRASGIQHPD